jgi:hypothetical protein
MKKKVFIILLLLIVGCKKYPEDDVTIHLRTVTKRLTTMLWCPDYNPGCNSGMTFHKNGTFNGCDCSPLNFNGTWKLIDHKKKLSITNSSNNLTFIFTIEKLECHYFIGPYNGSGDLILQNDTVTLHYVQHVD